ncbi:MAG TPA: tripartite tricarboxylate transporter substrate binding protein [Xanthobacteraceae bacterium]|nr:tripartite tricarboxylate transporter substrate binding protein [Xanthobacteraceae bacterium]
MNIRRRRFIHLVASAAAFPAAARIARADTYPSRPVHLVVGFSPGSASDINARLIGQWLSDRMGQSFVVDNRSGAGGNIATELVVRAKPDGYTLLYMSTAVAINPTLYEGKLSFDALRDLAPVASIVRTPFVMEVNKDLPVRTVPEFIAYAKANPGQINFATVGAGSAQHLYGEYFKMLTGIDMVPVHYRGAAPAITDMIAGRVQVMIDAVVSSLSYIKSGQLRALAVTTATPQPDLLPGIPTIGQFVPGYDASGWQGVCAPVKTPTEIVARLNHEIDTLLAEPKVKARLAELGGLVDAGTPADFGKFIAAETEKWGKVVRQAGVKAD